MLKKKTVPISFSIKLKMSTSVLSVFNVFPNKYTEYALWAPVSILLLWILSIILSFLHGNHHTHQTTHHHHHSAPVVNPNTVESGYVNNTVVTPVAPVAHVQENVFSATSNALHTLFTMIFSAWVLNALVNGINRKIFIFFWCLTGLGLAWVAAITVLENRFPRIARLFNFAMIAIGGGVAFLFINALQSDAYGNANRY